MSVSAVRTKQSHDINLRLARNINRATAVVIARQAIGVAPRARDETHAERDWPVVVVGMYDRPYRSCLQARLSANKQTNINQNEQTATLQIKTNKQTNITTPGARSAQRHHAGGGHRRRDDTYRQRDVVDNDGEWRWMLRRRWRQGEKIVRVTVTNGVLDVLVKSEY